jgi:putative flippase GtrA
MSDAVVPVPESVPAGRGANDRRGIAPGILAREGSRYFLASGVALSVGYGLLVALTEFLRIHYLVSATIGFATGLVVNYVLSVAFIFSERRLASRWIEFAGLACIGLVGLALNEGLMRLFVESVGLGYILAKIPAAGLGFMFNFVTRRLMLFTKAPGTT